ncbi:Octicosapeptide/Phox/Bem1p domain-containing protein / tetratricopeptide repeat-containing protein [Quillaja saponaria]|uniref:Octicosapeptide/Phox/Bem1p domain-containing protein / tetratricopeptide repeat-containing protein n=1 Tax=Quillaja saponaria TaxID=32244 RepID=A0AAD7PJ42_QUISA|nr:Octicosapeptide/Phox/Bem1p domain-containing protein / tetratricopeptide repeat-containing protein [Quillaja saponaria]
MKNKKAGEKSSDASGDQNKDRGGINIPKAYDKDAMVFMSMSQELKDEENKLFQKRDPVGAMSKYEKALKLLPKNHIDVSYLRSNMAACYMQMGLSEYPRAIHECNLALKVTPKYSKALLKRAREDTQEEEQQVEVKRKMEKIEDKLAEEKLENKAKERTTNKKNKKKSQNKFEEKQGNEKKVEVKEVVEEKINIKREDIPQKTVKLIYGKDIRWAQLPVNCSLLQLREVVCKRFPTRAVLVKYRDHEGDLVTITSNEELRWAEASVESQGSVRLYIVEVLPQQDPFFEKLMSKKDVYKFCINNAPENGNVVKGKQMKSSSCIGEWIIFFS